MLSNVQAAFPGQHRRVNQVHLTRSDRLHQPGQNGGLQRTGVIFGNLAFVADGYAQELAVGQVSQQLPDRRGHGNVGSQDYMDFRGNERSVNRVPCRFAVQYRQHLFRGFDGHFPLGLFGGRAQMGCYHHPGVSDQFRVLRRLLGEHVQRYPAQLARFQPVQDCLFVHQLTAGHVYQPGAGLEQGHLFCADHIPRAVGQRSVQGDEISLRQ